MNIYLYLKTHNITGLKYLGKTTKDPFKYKGSGKYWLRHLKKHGNNVTTEILHICKSDDELKKLGLKYSKKWNIVENISFANLKNETGDGGLYSNFDYSEHSKQLWNNQEYRDKQLNEGQRKRIKKLIGRKASDDHRKKISEALKGLKKSESHKQKLSEANKKPHAISQSVKNLNNAFKKETCTYCGLTTTIGNIRRWHNQNCKYKTQP